MMKTEKMTNDHVTKWSWVICVKIDKTELFNTFLCNDQLMRKYDVSGF